MQHPLKFIALGLILLCPLLAYGKASTRPPNLMDAFSQALSFEPNFQAEKSNLLSAKENVPINRSLLLPKARINGLTNYNYLNIRSSNRDFTVNVINQTFTIAPKGSKHFTNNLYSITLAQPIFNYADWSKFQASKATTKAATAKFGASYQGLMLEVSVNYFRVLEAKDILDFTIADRKAVLRYLKQNLNQYRVGERTRTDVYNALAQYDEIVSREIAAQRNLINARHDLQTVTGQLYTHMSGLADKIPLSRPIPDNVNLWVNKALQQNLLVQASHYGVDAAHQAIHIALAGHLPVVEGFSVGSYDQTSNIGPILGTFKSDTASGGVAMALPVYTGGLTQASVKKTQYLYQTSLSILQETRTRTENNTRQDFNNIYSGVHKIHADNSAIIANESAVKSTERGYKLGTRDILDLLQAQQQLFGSQVLYTTDRYAYFINTLRLKFDAGTLSPKDLEMINQYLKRNNNLMIKDKITTHYHIPTEAERAKYF